MVSRRWVMWSLLAGVSAPSLAAVSPARATTKKKSGKPKARLATSQAAPRPVQGAAELVAQAKLGGTVAYLVVEAASGRVLESANADVDLPPASVAKTLTTLYALETLGGDYRFRTQLVATGPVSGGVVQGDLVLLGGGDPTLDTDTLGDMAGDLKAAGVRGVTGRFLVNGSALPAIAAIDPSQPDQVDYNPGLSGLNLNFNRVYFGWTQQGGGYAVTMDARGARYAPPVSRARMAIVDRAGPQYTYDRSDGVEEWSVAQPALGRSGSRWLPVRDTAGYAGDVFRTLAAAQGIVLPASEQVTGPVAGSVLVQRQSDDLRTVLREMLKYSTNLTAEVVGLTASQARGGVVGSLAASAQRMQDWAQQRFGISVHLSDHSGLSGECRVTAGDLVTVLRAAGSDDLRGILKSIPIKDLQGRPMKGSPVQVQAKSGTLNFVSNLAGYETTPAGHELVFAILTGDLARSRAVPREDRERPYGVASWTARAHGLQQGFLVRWAAVFDG